MSFPRVIPLCLICILLLNACSVGNKLTVHASNASYPVSQTSSFYTSNDELIALGDYEILDSFSFTFKKWGVSGLIDIKSEADISSKLDELIEQQQGDAIVDMRISVHSPGVNSVLWFTKVTAFFAAAISIPVTIVEPHPVPAYIAVGSTLVYLFTPAAAEVKIEGTVVRLYSE